MLRHVTRTLFKDRKVRADHGKCGSMREDLFAEMCMRKNGVMAWRFSKDGCCKAKKPANEKKNKKWKPDCGSTNTPAIHPFKKPAKYKKCIEEAEVVLRRQLSSSRKILLRLSEGD